MRRILTAIQVKIIFWLVILLLGVVMVTLILRRSDGNSADASRVTSAATQYGIDFTKQLAERSLEERNKTADSQERAKNLVEEGNAALTFGDLASAKDSFNKAIQADSGLADAYYKLACAYAAEKRFPQLLDNLRKAITRDRKLQQTAREEPYFAPYRTSADFRALVSDQPKPVH